MTQYSMALNNSDYLSGNPDARTGLFSKVCTLEKLKGNSLSGPSFKLQLSFNPQLDFQNYLTPFGSGWGLSVPAFTRVSDAGDGHLILPSGKNFYITGLKEGSVPMEGYLLRDIQTDWSNAAGILTVREKSGDIQRYSRLAGDQTGNLYLSQTSSSSGRSLYFSYDSGQFNLPGGGMLTCLTAVKDDDGTTLASINYSTAAGKGTVITLFSEKEMTRQFTFLQSNNALKSISGPEGYQASFTYYYNNADGGVPMYLLSTVADTQGLYERVIYSVASNPDSGGITLPGGMQTQTTVQTFQRAGDLSVTDGSTDYIATYSFPRPGANQYNYLGNPIISTTDESKDSLLHHDGAFNYSSALTEQVQWPSPTSPSDFITVKKVTTTTYNKFHSLVNKVVSYVSDDGQYDGKHTLTEQLTYAATDGTIDAQIPTYALPLSHAKTWSDGAAWYTETQSFTWDDYANLTSHTDKTGINTLQYYYPAENPDDFVCHLQQKIITPSSPTSDGLPQAPVRQYDYTYDAVAGYGGATATRRAGMTQSVDGGATVVLKKNWVWQNDASTDPLNAVRLLSSSTTLPSSSGDKTTTTSLDYSLEDGGSTLRTIVTRTGFDGLFSKQRADRSVATGKTVATADITTSDTQPALTMNYTYDALGRTTAKIACQGTAFEARQTVSYIPSTQELSKFSPPAGNPENGLGLTPSAGPTEITTSIRGVQSVSVMDSQNNVLSQSQQDVDGIVSTDFAQWPTGQSRYDGLGNSVLSTRWDWFPGAVAGAPSVSATTTTLYDVWGQKYAVLTADGHVQISQYDPLTLIISSSLMTADGAHTQRQRETVNASGSVLKTERLEADSEGIYSTSTCDYDGLGRLVRSTDAMGNVTQITLDAFDRPANIIRPDNTVITPAWAPHSTDNLMSAITVAESQEAGADSYIYGTRTFDGLNRVTDMHVGGRSSTYHYSDNSAKRPERVATPAGAALTYTYQPELNEAVLTVISDASGDEAALSFSYNPTTGDNLTSDSDITAGDYAHRTLTYNLSGQTTANHMSYQLKSEESATRAQSSTYSLRGMLMTTTDASGVLHTLTSDTLGRPGGYTLSSDNTDFISANYRYDSLGRQDQTATTDNASGNTQTTTVTWDDHGREYQRTLAVAGSVSATQQQTLSYNLNDQITSRASIRNGQVLRTETYDYTALGQLQRYACTCPAGVPDYPDSPDGYQLAAQQFTFDFIGNITTVVSDLLDQDGNAVTNKATYTAGSADRTQLITITNDVVTDWDIALRYDENGNTTLDEQQQTLTYNSRNQLMSISDAASQPSGWLRYDADGLQLAEKKESDVDPTTLYYQTGGALINELQGTLTSAYVENLACVYRGSSDPDTVQLLGCDQQSSVIQISDESEVLWRVYDPYGYRK